MQGRYVTKYYLHWNPVRVALGNSPSRPDVFWLPLVIATGLTDNAYLYRGEQWESDLGLYFLRARFMNPDSGRFWNADTYEGLGENPSSLHKYTYASASPVYYIDPTGYFTLTEIQFTRLIESSLRGLARPSIKFAVRKGVNGAKCLVAEQIIDTAITEGIYLFSNSSGVPYVGQSVDMDRRFREHIRDRRLRRISDVIGRFATKSEKRLVEQFILDRVQSLQGRLQGELKNVGNKINPGGKKLRKVAKALKFCK